MYSTFKDQITRPLFVAWLAAMSALVFSLAAHAQQLTGLKLTIATDKPKIELGEPVYLTATLKNTGSDAIAVFPSLYPEDSALSIEITGPDDRTRGFVPYSLDLNDSVAEELAPGQSISSAFPVFYGGRGWTFRTPGNYQLRGVLVDPSQGQKIVASDAVSLTVSSSDNSGQYLMQEGKAGDEAGKFLLWQSGDHLRAGIAHLEGLVDQYPDSVLADHARLAFAHNLSRPFRDYTIGRLRAPDPDAAMRYLDKVRTDRLPLYLQVDYIVTRSRSLEVQGKTSKAKSVLKRAGPIIEKNPALNLLLERAEVSQ